jgi:rhamnosyltransferase
MPLLVSIVYLTKNGGPLFQKSLEAVFSQQVDFEFEVIAVDSGSTDGTLEFMKSQPVQVYSIPPAEFNFGLTRDYGFSLAQGKILVAISQDAIPVGTEWLQNLATPFADSSIAVVQGMDVLPENGDLFYWDKIRLFYYTRDVKKWMKAYDNVGVSFTACAIRRNVWAESPLGRVEMSEDKVFQKKIAEKGHKIARAREAMDYHSHMYDVKSLAKRCENEGLGWRNVGIRYSFFDMIQDMYNPLVIGALFHGIVTFKIKCLAEILFPVIRPFYVYKGNNYTGNYVR